MVTPMFDPHYFSKKAKQIRAHVSTALTERGLLPKFTGWRLAQDPSTSLVVLFGILNDKYIAAHTQTGLDAYFDPGLLHDLATDLQIQVIPSRRDGLHYAFVLYQGELGQQIVPLDFSDLQPHEPPAGQIGNHKPLILSRTPPGNAAALIRLSWPT
jgi:hypothetical protein